LQNSINNSSDSIIRGQTSCKLRFKDTQTVHLLFKVLEVGMFTVEIVKRFMKVKPSFLSVQKFMQEARGNLS